MPLVAARWVIWLLRFVSAGSGTLGINARWQRPRITPRTPSKETPNPRPDPGGNRHRARGGPFIRCDTCPNDHAPFCRTWATAMNKDAAAMMARHDGWDIRDALHRCPASVRERRTEMTS